MSLELENGILVDAETGIEIAKVSELTGGYLEFIIQSILNERDELQDEILELNLDLEVLQQKIEYYEEDDF